MYQRTKELLKLLKMKEKQNLHPIKIFNNSNLSVYYFLKFKFIREPILFQHFYLLFYPILIFYT